MSGDDEADPSRRGPEDPAASEATSERSNVPTFAPPPRPPLIQRLLPDRIGEANFHPNVETAVRACSALLDEG